MENTIQTLNVGDLVTLKTHTNFRGVVHSFRKGNDNFGKPWYFKGPVSLNDNLSSAKLSIIDDNRKVTYEEISVILLKVVEKF
jgi:hypothetical protein